MTLKQKEDMLLSKPVEELREIASKHEDYQNFITWTPFVTRVMLVRFILEAKLV